MFHPTWRLPINMHVKHGEFIHQLRQIRELSFVNLTEVEEMDLEQSYNRSTI